MSRFIDDEVAWLPLAATPDAAGTPRAGWPFDAWTSRTADPTVASEVDLLRKKLALYKAEVWINGIWARKHSAEPWLDVEATERILDEVLRVAHALPRAGDELALTQLIARRELPLDVVNRTDALLALVRSAAAEGPSVN